MNLKNKFHGEVRKILRTLNRLTMRVLKKRIKPLKEKSLLRVFYIVEDGAGWGESAVGMGTQRNSVPADADFQKKWLP